jgi:hypothetical protein
LPDSKEPDHTSKDYTNLLAKGGAFQLLFLGSVSYLPSFVFVFVLLSQNSLYVGSADAEDVATQKGLNGVVTIPDFKDGKLDPRRFQTLSFRFPTFGGVLVGCPCGNELGGHILNSLESGLVRTYELSHSSLDSMLTPLYAKGMSKCIHAHVVEEWISNEFQTPGFWTIARAHLKCFILWIVFRRLKVPSISRCRARDPPNAPANVLL